MYFGALLTQALLFTPAFWSAEKALSKLTVNYELPPGTGLETFADEAKSTMEQWHPKISEILGDLPNSAQPSEIFVTFDSKYDGAAAISNSKIRAGVDYYERNNRDVGSMIHEMVHDIQNWNANKKPPSWLTEGLADYIRYYKFNDPNDSKPTKPTSEQSYRDSYKVSAYFINYLVENAKNGETLVAEINKAGRDGTYDDSIFETVTGIPLDQHWKNMMELA